MGLNKFQKERTLDFILGQAKTEGIPDMELLETGLHNALSDSEGAVREMCSHILSAGGKRIRPKLLLNSGYIFSARTADLMDAAIAAELIHMASLVHDDIIDKSSMRRHKPSINSLWGNTYAVLCGDYLFAKAFGIMATRKLTGCINHMVEGIQNMCHGEIILARERFNFSISLNTYYKSIAQKTAIFLSCCCKAGASVAGASERHMKLLGEYGLNLGFAFQIIDDILDFTGHAEVMGKARHSDLRQGNITLPVILLLQDRQYGDMAKEAVEKNPVELVIEPLIKMVNESGVISQSFDAAKVFIDRAKQCLRHVPQSEHTYFLNELTDKLLVRTS